MNVGIAETAESFDQLLSTNTDAIVIATPPELHADQAIAAIEHGKAVFVRKPLGVDLHETQLVVDVARGNCILLAVDLPYRLDVAPSSSAAITLADDALLFDAVDTALFALRAPRVLRVSANRIELAANRFIEISRGNTNEVRIDTGTIPLQGGADRALHAFMKRLAESREFDESIESIVDAARVVEEMAEVRSLP
jgi:hypothetical protein